MVYVKCYADRSSFENRLIANGVDPVYVRGVIAYYDHPRYRGGDESTINMRAGTCNLARQFTLGLVTQESAGAFKTLLHEALHRQGLHNEKETELYAIATMEEAGRMIAYSYGGNLDAGGERAKRLAWQQSRARIARNYLSQWSEVRGLSTSWWDAIDLHRQLGR